MTNRKYFDLSYRLDRENRHLIWYTDDQDGVIVDSDVRVPTFENADALRIYAQNRGLTVQVDEGGLFDLDAIARWLENPNTLSIDCSNVLNAWNLFDDVAHCVCGVFDVD